MPIVSVIVPNYNHAKFLDQRIDSIINQTYQQFELIILDDCSTDNSREIIEQYRMHPKVSKIVFNEVNSGSPFEQWEKGIGLATGEYIWIAESDDYADERFLESLMALIKIEPETGLAYCGSYSVDEQGNKLDELMWDIENNRGNYYCNTGKFVCINYLFFRPIIPNASAVIFKRDAFKNVDAGFKQYTICGDWQFWIDVCYPSKIVWLPVPLNFFRQVNTSVSRKYSSDSYKRFLLETLKIALHIQERSKGLMPPVNIRKFIDNFLFIIELEFFRKKISLNGSEVKWIYQSLNRLSPLITWFFFKALSKVAIAALGAKKRKLLYIIDERNR